MIAIEGGLQMASPSDMTMSPDAFIAGPNEDVT